MTPDQKQFLSILRLPARLTPEQTATVLGFQPHDIPVLVANRLLKPLGNPPPNAQKYFAAKSVEELGADVKWLDRATDAIYRHWRMKNSRRLPPAGSPCDPSHN